MQKDDEEEEEERQQQQQLAVELRRAHVGTSNLCMEFARNMMQRSDYLFSTMGCNEVESSQQMMARNTYCGDVT